MLYKNNTYLIGGGKLTVTYVPHIIKILLMFQLVNTFFYSLVESVFKQNLFWKYEIYPQRINVVFALSNECSRSYFEYIIGGSDAAPPVSKGRS